MKKLTLSVSCVLLAVLAGGCTSLNSKALSSQSSSPPGLAYRLPAKQFSVLATFEITGCKARQTDADLEAIVAASLSESLVGGEAYTIDYEQLSTWTKVTNTEFQLSEAGLLTGVNASIVDQSGAVISNSVTAVASIARAAFLPTIPALGTANFKQREALKAQSKRLDFEDPCKEVNEAIAAKKAAETDLEREKKNDKERAKFGLIINDSALQISALKSLAETYEKLGNQDDKTKLLRRIQLQEKIKDEAGAALKVLGESKTEKAVKSLAEAKSKLVVTGSRDFVPSLVEKSIQIPVAIDGLSALFGDTLDATKVHLPSVSLSVEKIPLNRGNEDKTPVANKIGIAYRIPVAAIARVEYRVNEDGLPNLLVEKSTQVPQLGPVGSISLNNQMFDDNLVELAFSGTTGTLSKLTFRAKAKAETATATARDAAGTYLQLQKNRRDDQVAANKTLLEQATAKVALEKAQSDLALAKVQSEAAVAKTEAQLQQESVAAQVQLLRDQQRLDAVRTGTATAAEVELEALNTQEQLLAQRLRILKLEQELANQKSQSTTSVP